MAAEATVRGAAGTQTRRGFLAFLGWGTMALVGLQATVAFIVFFWPRKLGTFGGKLSAGAPDQYKEGEVKYFVDGKFYLVRLGASDELVAGTSAVGGFLALYQKCVHLGCTVPWRDDFVFVDPNTGQSVKGWFRCPCHGSTYTAAGVRVFGPAPRSMDHMLVTIDPGTKRISVNSGRITKGTPNNATFAVKAP